MPILGSFGGVSGRRLGLTAKSPGKPGAPGVGALTVGVNSGNVRFTAPASDGGLPITKYTATSNTGGITASVVQSGDGTIEFTGLSANTTYTFSVIAENSLGASPSSAPSNSARTRRVETFTGSGSFTIPKNVTELEYLVVAGGGAGGFGGGGGAGGIIGGNAATSADTVFTITIGGGGSPAAPTYPSKGIATSISGGPVSVSSTGGGTGGGYQGGPGATSGGSGGGGGQFGSNTPTGISGQGNNGASQGSYRGYPAGGGGGGGGASGSVGSSPGWGGIGLLTNITGTGTYYAGGGNGGTFGNMAGENVPQTGTKSPGGGGAGEPRYPYGQFAPADANTGGGGGGNNGGGTPGAGGSGLVIFSFVQPG